MAELDLTAFKSDQKTQYAVVRALEMIGEASKMVPDTIRQGHPEIPWKKMAGMRDKLIHAYFGTDLDLIWRTVSELLPALRPRIQSILDETEKD